MNSRTYRRAIRLTAVSAALKITKSNGSAIPVEGIPLMASSSAAVPAVQLRVAGEMTPPTFFMVATAIGSGPLQREWRLEVSRLSLFGGLRSPLHRIQLLKLEKI